MGIREHSGSLGFVDRWFPNYHTWSRARVTLFLLCFYFLTAAVPYFVTNQIAAWRDASLFNPNNFIDDMIPYMSWNIVFYFSFYLYFPIVAWYGSKEGQRRIDGFLFHQYLTLSTWAACILFLIAPVKVQLRPKLALGEGVFDQLLSTIHEADPPFNSWPSLHVFQSALIVMVIRHWMKSDGTWTNLSSAIIWVFWSLLVLSTMGIKQHYMFDAVTGVLFAALVWVYFCKPNLNRIDSNR
ncbi:MAG: phosphatase PAP2 family protein [Euryarchaeota archaeon]|tara:strand:- start:445 stop:1164 length:720 start_codon:yes stop_codon:yes gene_type:complete